MQGVRRVSPFAWLLVLGALALAPRETRGDQRTRASQPTAAPASTAAAPASAEPAIDARWKSGPQAIDLGRDLTLALPADHVFLPPAEASKVLEKMGNFHNEDLLGVVASKDDQADWFVTIRYEEEGYIKDDEKIDADELLQAIREGTERANKERVEKGFKPLKVDGWIDSPRYEKSVHHLVWALQVSDDEGKSINYNTRVLGRRGYASINLVTGPEHLAEYKPQAAALLAASAFMTGSRYEDFNTKTDKVAEYGLAGLVLGGAGLAAAKLVKIGLLAKFWNVILAVLIAGKKAIIVALIAAGAFMKKLFGSKKAQPEAPPDR